MVDRSSSQDRNEIRNRISETLKLNLTDSEIEALLAGEVITLDYLLQNHSLSEVGTALIQADALQSQESTEQADQLKSDKGKEQQKVICIWNGRLCIEFVRPGMRLKL